MSRAEAQPASYSIRTHCEDFVVVEEPLYSPSGEGTHTFLCVEKRGRTTEQVARELARAAGVPPGAVGYAGRKDRHAVTRQWFSLPDIDPASLQHESKDELFGQRRDDDGRQRAQREVEDALVFAQRIDQGVLVLILR